MCKSNLIILNVFIICVLSYIYGEVLKVDEKYANYML